MFNYSQFFNLAELDIDYISIVNIKNTIKVYSDSIGESMAEATLEKKEVFLDKKETTQQIVTLNLTPDREKDYGTNSIEETRATYRPVSYIEVPSNTVAIGT
jgi:hypothetical protein